MLPEIQSVHFHNGGNDASAHYSREFVKDIIDKTPYLSHSFNVDYLDVPGSKKDLSTADGVLFVDTHVALNNCDKFLEHFLPIYESLNISPESADYYVPSIDFSYFNTTRIEDFFQSTSFDKYILIVDSPNPIVEAIASAYPNYGIVVTRGEYSNKNVFCFSELIEIAYLSTKCQFVIGFPGISFCYSHIKQSLFDETKSFIFVGRCLSDGVFYQTANQRHIVPFNENYIANKLIQMLTPVEEGVLTVSMDLVRHEFVDPMFNSDNFMSIFRHFFFDIR